MNINNNEIQNLIVRYAHDYRDMKLNQQELALMLSVFGDELKDVIFKLLKNLPKQADSYSGNDLVLGLNKIVGIK